MHDYEPLRTSLYSNLPKKRNNKKRTFFITAVIALVTVAGYVIIKPMYNHTSSPVPNSINRQSSQSAANMIQVTPPAEDDVSVAVEDEDGMMENNGAVAVDEQQ